MTVEYIDDFNAIADLVRSIMIAVVMVTLAVFVIWEIRKNDVFIGDILTPETLQRQGYTSTVATRRLHDEIDKIRLEVRSVADRSNQEKATEPSEKTREEVNDFSVTVPKWLINYMRNLFRKEEQSVDGEIVLTGSVLALRLRVRVQSSKQRFISVESSDIDDLMKAAAEKYLLIAAPRTLASFYNKKGVELKNDGKWEQANGEYRKSLDALPKRGNVIDADSVIDAATAYTNWGLSLAEMGDFAAAVEKFEHAVKVHPQSAYAYVIWGEVLKRKGHNDEAIKKFEKAFEVDCFYAYACVAWAEALAAAGNSEQAIAKLRTALWINHRYDYAYVAWGTLLFDKLNNPAAAAEKLQRAIEINPDHTQAHVLLGKALAALGECDKAVEHFKTALEIDPRYDFAYFAWGDVLLTNNDPAAAANKFQKVIDIKHDHVYAYVRWGVALAEQGAYDDAVEKFQTALKFKRDYAYAYCAWGSLLLDNLNDPVGAVDKFQQTIEADSQFDEAYVRWGDALRALGSDSEAAEKYKKALEVNPHNAQATVRLDQLRTAEGDREGAIYEKFGLV